MIGAVLAAGATGAAAWGRDAHKVVADVAQARLTPPALRRALRLAGGNLSGVANWADEVSHELRWSEPLHFLNVDDPDCVPPGACTFVYARDCTHGETPDFCNVGAIHNYTRRLNASFWSGAGGPDVADAFKFVVHFVADVHQPLHCGMARDRGGVKLDEEFAAPGEGDHMNLHAVWDYGLIVRRIGAEGRWAELTAEVEGLLRGQWAGDAAAWSGELLDVAAWAQESLTAAAEKAYVDAANRTIPDHGVVADSYYADRMAVGGVVDRRLAQAGVRLARTLNCVLDPRSASPALCSGVFGA